MQQRNKTLSNPYLYQQYLIKYNKELKVLEDNVNTLKIIKAQVNNFILENFKGTPVFGTYTLESFKNKSIARYLKHHKDFYKTSKELYFIQKLKDLKRVKINLYIAEDKLKIHLSYYFSKEQFQFITERTNQIMLDRMITTGESYVIHHTLGLFKIFKLKNKKMVIDHGTSTKLKNEILARGGTLYSKENPTGERFKAFHTVPFNYSVLWIKDGEFLKQEKIKNYRFYPVEGNHCVSKKIYDHIRNDPNAISKYTPKYK